MSIERTTVLDQIEVYADNAVGVRLALLLMDGHTVVDKKYHRFVLVAGVDVDATIAAVSEHLEHTGKPPIEPSDADKIKQHYAVAFTK